MAIGPTRVVLTDFGLARGVATGSRLTRTGEAIGTPAYMSPEQARGDVAALTPASDVWALGCVLHELLDGARAFPGDEPAAVIGAVLTGRPARLRHGPSPARNLVARALVRAPHRRPAGAAELATLCRHVLAGGRVRRPGAARRWGLRGGLTALAAGVAALVLAPWAPPPGPDGRGADDEDLARLAETDADAAAATLDGLLAAGGATSAQALQCGLLHWAQGRNARARAVWTAIAEGTPEFGWAQFHLGLEAFMRRQHEALLDSEIALPDLRRVPADGGMPRRLAVTITLLGTRRLDRAREELRGLDDWRAALLRGLLEGVDGDGDPERALREIDAAIRAAPWCVLLHLDRSSALGRLGRHREAIEAATAAVRRAPRMAFAYARRAHEHLELAHTDDALVDAQRAVALDGADPYGRTLLAVVLLQRGRLAEALAAVDAALALDPDRRDARINRARILLGLGDPAGALADLDAHPGGPAPDAGRSQVRGELLWALGRAEDAAAEYSRVAELAPTVAAHWFQLGRTLERLGQAGAAVAALDRALALAPDSPGAYEYRGRARLRLGEREAAAADFARMTAAVPDAVEARLLHAQVLADLDRWAEAHEVLARGLARAPDSFPMLVQRAAWRHHDGRYAEALDDAERAARQLDAAPPATGQADREQLIATCYWVLGDAAERLGRDGRAALARGIAFIDGTSAGGDVPAPAADARPRLWIDRARLRAAMFGARLRHGEVGPDLLAEARAALDGPVLPPIDRARLLETLAEQLVQHGKRRGTPPAQAIPLLDAAITLFTEAIELAPERPSSRSGRGLAATSLVLAQRATGRIESDWLDAAEADLRAVCEQLPASADAQFNLGLACWSRADVYVAAHLDPGEAYDRAIAAFARAAGLEPTLARAHEYHGETLRLRGRLTEALVAYERAAALRPDDARLGEAVRLVRARVAAGE